MLRTSGDCGPTLMFIPTISFCFVLNDIWEGKKKSFNKMTETTTKIVNSMKAQKSREPKVMGKVVDLGRHSTVQKCSARKKDL